MDVSEASTTEDDLTEEARNVRLFATQMLKQRIFVGCFKERRRVDPLNEYRDVIVVNDAELKKDMDIVRKRLRDVYGDCWIGITRPNYIGAPYGHCLWVQAEDHALGSYLYKIKTVKFRRNEIIVRVKRLKSLDDTLQNTSESIETQVSDYIQNFSLDKTLDELKKSFLKNTVLFFTTILTIDNMKDTITFLSVLFVTSVAFAFKSVQFFMDFFLKFMRELSHLVQSFTPVMLSIVDLFGKIIGGFYLLICAIYRDSRRSEAPQLVAPRQRYLPIEARQRQAYDYYKPRSSVVIREIEN